MSISGETPAGQGTSLARSVMGAGYPRSPFPSGFDSDGMPTGIQFMSRAYDENICIALGRAYQERTDWHNQHPADLVGAE